PEGSDGGTRIDVGLVEMSPDGTLAELDKSPGCYELFAVIEAKCSVSGEDEAFEQLLLYTRQLYALQHDRRFAWGVIVCGSSVRVCLLGPNEAVFASTVMDVATGPGRKAFVEFLVNCSFCDTNNLYRGLPITTTTGNDGGSGGPALIWPSREHRRIVMRPVDEPLRFLESLPELIIVLHDVMKCHGAVVEECRILHRDISTNIILVVRLESGRVRDMLIDFDCAIDMEGSEGEARTEMTGTQPFMSVLNLENSSVKRTALDDWESLLYMVCWLGTYGINEHTQRKEDDSELEDLTIREWRYGSFDKIALDKRKHLDTLGHSKPTSWPTSTPRLRIMSC
ncbi:hypothetical protein EV182_000307, partial [Spiromyces aspiralis]